MSYNTITYIDREDTRWLMSGWGGALPATEEDQALLRGNGGTELLNMRAVANAVVKRVHELDVMEQAQTLSTVRLDRGFEVGTDYPMHGVVVVGDIGLGRDLEAYLNTKFTSDPSRFPRSRGWRAVATDSTSKQVFNKEHPFFHYRETGRISQNAARILIVVDRATEGMNNKYLGVMGVAKKAGSILEMVQRLGRLVRSAHYAKDGKFYAPPVAHDMVHVITHVDYGNEDTIEAALAFMLNMDRALEDMVSIDEYAQFGNDVEDDDPSYKPTLSYEDMMTISDIVGEAIITGKRLSIKKIHNRISTRKAAKREYITHVARELYARNEGACDRVVKDLFRAELPDPLDDLAVDDKIRIEPLSEDELDIWLKANALTAMLALHEKGSPIWLEAGRQIHRVAEGKYYAGQMESSQTAVATIDELVSEIVRVLRFSNGQRAVVAHYTETAVLSLLENIGATPARLADDGDLNIPAVVAELRNPNWKGAAIRWVFWRLYEDGYLKNLKPFVEGTTSTVAKAW